MDENFDPTNQEHVQTMIEEQQAKQQKTWGKPEEMKNFGLQGAAKTAQEQAKVDEQKAPVKKVEPVNPFAARMQRIREGQK